jgi:hypothetical protein
MLQVGFLSLRPEVHTFKQLLGMKNDIALFQNTSELLLAKIGFKSVGGSAMPNVLVFIQ